MFANDSFAKVWKIIPKESEEQKYTQIQLSTSKKNKKTDRYETDFSDYARLVGDAEKKAGNLEAEDKIKIVKCGVNNHYDKEKRKMFYQFVIFDFEIEKKKQSNDTDWVKMDEIPDSELPFAD